MHMLEQALHSAIEHHEAGRLGKAESGYREVLAIEPNHPDALNLLGLVAYQTGRCEWGADLIRQAIAVRPGSAMYHQNLGLVLGALGRTSEAIESYRAALRRQPAYAMASDNLGYALTVNGQIVEAVVAHRQALRVDPAFAWAHCHLGAALAYLGQFDEAEGHFRRALELNPGDVRMHQDYLGFLHYKPRITLAELLGAHREFEQRHATPLRASWKPHTNARDPERRLRLGFVSAHFATHPVGHFLVRALENLDRGHYEVVCYSDTLAVDSMTERLKRTATVWREISAIPHEELAKGIRADGIDILFDLAGHTSWNRLPAFARKPAPIQVTWMDYVGTTGLAAMDYILGDAKEVPSGAEWGYSERVLRMPDDYICYDPPADGLPVNPLPALAGEGMTFGCFNMPAKLNEPHMEVWARILRRVPGSRLLLKTRGMDDPATAAHVLRMLAGQGIEAERVKLLGWSSAEKTRASYQMVDVALDTYPYNGGLTTCEALWMGVPVVTCPGETFAGRHGMAHLTAAGLPETIATDLDEYVEIAVGLAEDLPRLAELRMGLRARVEASPLCDGPRFAGHFGALMREVWRKWARGDQG